MPFNTLRVARPLANFEALANDFAMIPIRDS